MSFFLFCWFLLLGTRTVWAGEKVITDFSRMFYIPAGVLLQGQDPKDLRSVYDNMNCVGYTEDGEELQLEVVWDYSRVNSQKVGAYEIAGTVKLPAGYTCQKNFPVWTAGISVQKPGQPEIQVYSRMLSAGLYYFPWIIQDDPDQMEIWMKEEGENWVNVSEEGYGMCDTDGMYLSCQSMLPGRIYTLTVRYGSQKTRNLKYRYCTDGTLEFISYLPGSIGETIQRETVIHSLEVLDEKSLERCMAYAVSTGQDLQEIKEELESGFHLLGSVREEYEDTAAYPSVVLPSVWDLSEVDTGTPGVYKVTGTFTAPAGYTLDASLEIPVATAYLSVQSPDEPKIQTYFRSSKDTFFFPMVLEKFTEKQLQDFQVSLECEGNPVDLTARQVSIEKNGLTLGKDVFAPGRDYGLFVTYNGKSTGIYTFHFDESSLSNEHWYERNYADRDGKDLPDLDTGTEKVSQSTTVVTGNRLSSLIKMGKNKVSFEKDGILVQIPVEVMEQWEVKAEDEIQVDIIRENDQVSVGIYKNGEEITDIPGATVEIPYGSYGEDADTQTTLTDEAGNLYTGTVNEEQKVAVIPVEQTGTYQVDVSSVEETDIDNEAEEAETESTKTEEANYREMDEEEGIMQVSNSTNIGDASDSDTSVQTVVTIIVIILILLILLLKIRHKTDK